MAVVSNKPVRDWSGKEIKPITKYIPDGKVYVLNSEVCNKDYIVDLKPKGQLIVNNPNVVYLGEIAEGKETRLPSKEGYFGAQNDCGTFYWNGESSIAMLHFFLKEDPKSTDLFIKTGLLIQIIGQSSEIRIHALDVFVVYQFNKFFEFGINKPNDVAHFFYLTSYSIY